MAKKSTISTSRLIKKRDALMKRLAEIGTFTRGSLVTAQRGNHTAHQLTVSVNGKTHTVYIPIEMVDEVEQWVKNYKEVQKLIKEISKANMAIIHNRIPELRADAERKRNLKKLL
jgi:uncharacterized protein with ACT and thioredoxin-like domain